MTKDGSGGGLLGMAAQLKRLQEDLKAAQASLEDETVEASAGRGAVKVVMSGTQECRQITITSDLLPDDEAAKLQDLLCLAVNQAIRDSQSLAARRLGAPAKGLTGLGPGT